MMDPNKDRTLSNPWTYHHMRTAVLQPVKLAAGLTIAPVFAAVLAVLCAVGCVGCSGAGPFQAVERQPGPFELALVKLADVSEQLADTGRSVADAVAVIKPTTADDVNAAADALAENAGTVARAADTIAASVAAAGQDQAKHTAAIIDAIGTAAGVAGTFATGNPAAGAATQTAAVSLSQLVYAVLGALGLTGTTAGFMRYRENKAWDEATATAREATRGN